MFSPQLIEAIRQGPQGLAGRSTVGISNRDGTAVLEVRGVLTRYASFYQWLFGGAATSDIRAAFLQAINDSNVSSVLMLLDSPGGSAAGIAELSDIISSAKSAGKPVYVQIDGTLASAAYHFGSQADKVFASHRSNQVGSIGTVMVVEDTSQLLAAEGRKIHVFATGELKTIGYPGVELTDVQKAYLQESVQKIQSEFESAIMRGRKITKEQLAKMADGRAVDATEAVNLGLIDGIQSFDQTLAMLQGLKKTPTKEKRMSGASYAELKAECAGASAEFFMQCLDKGLDVTQARQAFTSDLLRKVDQQATANTALQAELATARTEVADLKTKLEQASKVPEVPAGGTQGANTADVAQFSAIVSEKVKAGTPRDIAVKQAMKANPDLYQAFLKGVK